MPEGPTFIRKISHHRNSMQKMLWRRSRSLDNNLNQSPLANQSEPTQVGSLISQRIKPKKTLSKKFSTLRRANAVEVVDIKPSLGRSNSKLYRLFSTNRKKELLKSHSEEVSSSKVKTLQVDCEARTKVKHGLVHRLSKQFSNFKKSKSSEGKPSVVMDTQLEVEVANKRKFFESYSKNSNQSNNLKFVNVNFLRNIMCKSPIDYDPPFFEVCHRTRLLSITRKSSKVYRKAFSI